MEKSRTTRTETYMAQRDALLYGIHKKFGLNALELSKFCKEYGWKIERRAISDVLREKERAILQEEVDKELEIEEQP